MKLKPAGKSGAGEALVHCPVCDVVYLKHSLVQHWSQMAGKEAQYKMADLVYASKENNGQIKTGLYEVLEDCPHWKFLLAIKKAPNSRPVAKKDKQTDWYSALQAYLAEA